MAKRSVTTAGKVSPKACCSEAFSSEKRAYIASSFCCATASLPNKVAKVLKWEIATWAALSCSEKLGRYTTGAMRPKVASKSCCGPAAKMTSGLSAAIFSKFGSVRVPISCTELGTSGCTTHCT
ncbi:Uncharacterised protein [Vibrio cholerae]|nr:Uncharacterised protein [Vibrio cholerae]